MKALSDSARMQVAEAANQSESAAIAMLRVFTGERDLGKLKEQLAEITAMTKATASVSSDDPPDEVPMDDLDELTCALTRILSAVGREPKAQPTDEATIRTCVEGIIGGYVMLILRDINPTIAIRSVLAAIETQLFDNSGLPKGEFKDAKLGEAIKEASAGVQQTSLVKTILEAL